MFVGVCWLDTGEGGGSLPPVRNNELVLPLYRVRAHDLVPRHLHEYFQPLSYYHKRLPWHKWLFGLQSRAEHSQYASFWGDDAPLQDCQHCGCWHDMSPHSCVAGIAARPTPSLLRGHLPGPTPTLSRHGAQLRSAKDVNIVCRMATPRSHLRLRLGSPHGVAPLPPAQARVCLSTGTPSDRHFPDLGVCPWSAGPGVGTTCGFCKPSVQTVCLNPHDGCAPERLIRAVCN